MKKDIEYGRLGQKIARIFCVVFAVLFAVYLIADWKYVLVERQFDRTSMVKLVILAGVWAAGIVVGMLPFWFRGRADRALGILYAVAAPFYIFACMQTAMHSLPQLFQMKSAVLLFNLAAIAVLELLFAALLNRLRAGVMVCAVICVMYAVVNYFVYEFRGSPILAADFTVIGTAAEVAGNYRIRFNFTALLVLLALFLFLMAGTRITEIHLFAKKRWWGSASLAMIAVCAVFVNRFVMTDFLKEIGVNLRMFDPLDSYQKFGNIAILSESLHYAFPEKPDGYSPERAQEIAKKYSSDQVKGTEDMPNVIVIVNEAFSDLKVLGDFETNEEYMPFWDSLMGDPRYVTGTTYASIVGGQTANTEFEILTDNSMAFLPQASVAFQLYINHEMPSLVRVMESEGYIGNTAVHLHRRTNYQRNKVYPFLGFETFYDRDTSPLPLEKFRRYPTDECDYDVLLHDYEEKRRENPDTPYFGYTMTIQNHSPFEGEFDNFDPQVSLKGINAPDMDQYLSLIKYSDQAFKNLTEYFSKVNEPTVIMMTGDHQPRISSNFMDAVTHGEYKHWSDVEQMKRYEIPFVIWANYEIPGKKVEKTSMNYLQTLLLETIGGGLTGYQKFLKEVQEQVPVLTANGYWGADGKFYHVKDESSPYYELLQEYAILQYNDLMDPKHRVEDFFELAE